VNLLGWSYVKTGRYGNNAIDRNRRFCSVKESIVYRCGLREIEEEYHFVIVCPAYDHLSRMYFN